MSKLIRVLQIGMTSNIGGTETYLMQQYRHLNLVNVIYDFVNVTGERDIAFAQEINDRGSAIYSVCSRHINPVKHYFQWIKLLCNHAYKYDAIVLNANSLSYVFPLLCGKIFNIPVRVIHSHNSGYNTKPSFLRLFLVYVNRYILKFSATHFFACSKLAGKWMFGKNSKFEIIYNAIDTSKFAFNEIKRNRIRDNYEFNNEFVIGHIGRFAQQKNHGFLIDIFAEVARRRPEARLLLLGDGELMNDIKQKVERLGLTDIVIFTGSVSNPEDYYQAMDCFVLPSLFEGLPIVGVEAQASGLPCLFSDTITDEVGITDLAEFLSITDASIWADRICALREVSDRSVYAQKVAEAGYDINVEAKKLERFYLTGKWK